jgi:type I restriction enzyme R subunit
MHGLFPKRLTDLVLDSMTDYEKLSTEILENESSQSAFAMLILRLLTEQRRIGDSGTS